MGQIQGDAEVELVPQRWGRFSIVKLLGVAAALGLLYLLGGEAGRAIPRFAAWVESLGVWGPFAFMVGYVVGVIALVPGSILTLAAGAIFGLLLGTVYVFIAATIGACGAFLVARYLARGSVEQRLGQSPRFAAIDRAVSAEGRRIVFLLRLSPVFPFSLLNYALGLTRIRFADYFVASVGMIPGTLLYVYYGKLVGDVAALAGGAAVEKGPAYYAVLVVGLLATVLVTTLVTRSARRALREATGE
ncbi:MAG: TVP38/TMEM64 family protein [Myxococcota bacterium]